VLNAPPMGPLMPAWKRGFWLKMAESKVDPDLGRPEMK
jgi:hypothetical protein